MRTVSLAWHRLFNTRVIPGQLWLSRVRLCDPMDCSPPLLCPWNSLDKNTGVGSHFLLQGIILTQGSNPSLLHCRRSLYHWATWEALKIISTNSKIEKASSAVIRRARWSPYTKKKGIPQDCGSLVESLVLLGQVGAVFRGTDSWDIS